MIGLTLGHFEILEKLGEGGMGVVYKARDTDLDRLVAIKILRADMVADRDRRLRFTQEAKSASALNHPGIVTIHEIAQHEGVDFIVMELVPGRTLDRVIPPHGLGLAETLDFAVQIADAVATAHAAGIVHRDLKPANVVVTDHGRIKVLDFGLAKLIDRSGPPAWGDGATATQRAPVTHQGAIVGTPAYMAPEQAEGKTVDARTDIFSFGAMLYEMVTGQRAFQRDSPLSTLTAVLRDEPKPIGDISGTSPSRSRELERIIARCLRKPPERRSQSMADVAIALRELREASESGASTRAPAVRSTRLAWTVATLIAVIGAGLIGAIVWRERSVRGARPAAALVAIPLTTYQGREQQPAFSPDGTSVAFAWNGETEENWDIYVKLIGPGSPQRLTTDPAMDLSPAWSPDGSSIALVRVRNGRLIVIVVPSRGGPEREVLDTLKVGGLGFGQVLSWSADSRLVVIGASPSVETPEVLTAVDVATGRTTPVTTPSPAIYHESLPSVSPDGKLLAFVRRSDALTGELHVQALSATFAPIGEPRRLRADGRFYHGLAWSADGRDVIVSSGNQGDVALWRIPLRSPDQLERLSLPGDEWRQPAVAMQRDRLAFTRARWDDNLWSLPLSAEGRAAGSPFSLIGSTRSERNARFSPDGTRIVFESQRSGPQEVWVADRDGRNALQLTSFNGGQGGTATWSPDGQSIAYDLRNDDGRGDIYVVPARGGAPRRVTNHPADDLVPSWSRHGQSIYFLSNRSGSAQIWKMSPQGGEPVQVTRHGGIHGKESVDGRYVYYSRLDSLLPSLWRVPVSGGEEVEVLREIAGVLNFAVARDGIYFESPPPSSPLGHIAMLTPFTRPQYIVDFLSFATGRVTRVMTMGRHAALGLDVAPDGRTLLFAQSDSFTEDLMLVENFR